MKFLFFLITILVFLIIDFIFYRLIKKYDFKNITIYNIGQGTGVLAIFLIFLIYQLIGG